MKKFYLLAILFLGSLFSFAQEFTPPDSAAIIKNRVKSIKVYYTGTGNKHLITHEYRYDKNGRCIYSRDGSAGYYYSFTYTEKGQIATSYQRALSGAIIQGHKKDYTADGKLFHTQVFTERDTVRPGIIYTYGSTGNVVEESHFNNGKLIRNYKTEYDINNKIIHRIDSTPGKSVYETLNSKTVRQTYYYESEAMTENWLLSYDAGGRLIKTICITTKSTDTYTVIYDKDLEYKILGNGKPISKEDYIKWDSKFRWLMPRQVEEDFGLPYADPVANYKYNHELKRDKKDNIIKDIITGAYPYMNFKPVEFDYEYEYW